MPRQIYVLLCSLGLLLSGCAQQRMNEQANSFLLSLNAPAPSPALVQLQTLRAQAREQQAGLAAAKANHGETLIWQFSANQQQPDAEQLRSFQAWHRQHPGSLRLQLGPASADSAFAAAQAALKRAQALQAWLREQGLQAELSYQPQLPAQQLQWLSPGGDGA